MHVRTAKMCSRTHGEGLPKSEKSIDRAAPSCRALQPPQEAGFERGMSVNSQDDKLVGVSDHAQGRTKGIFMLGRP